MPAVVRMAAMGVAVFGPACGDDGSGETAMTAADVHPTDCHGDPSCAGTTGTEPTTTNLTSMDEAPTIPCAHDPSNCGTTGTTGTQDGSTGADSSDGDSSSDEGSSSGDTGGSSSGTAGG